MKFLVHWLWQGSQHGPQQNLNRPQQKHTCTRVALYAHEFGTPGFRCADSVETLGTVVSSDKQVQTFLLGGLEGHGGSTGGRKGRRRGQGKGRGERGLPRRKRKGACLHRARERERTSQRKGACSGKGGRGPVPEDTGWAPGNRGSAPERRAKDTPGRGEAQPCPGMDLGHTSEAKAALRPAGEPRPSQRRHTGEKQRRRGRVRGRGKGRGKGRLPPDMTRTNHHCGEKKKFRKDSQVLMKETRLG